MTVDDILKFSTENTLALLKKELEIRLRELQEAWHLSSLEKIFIEGDEAFVTYRCTAKGGKSFRNTEFFAFAGDKVRRIDAYFGASYQDGAFVKQPE